MFEWLFGKRDKQLEDKTKKGFDDVKKDIDRVGEWIKHLDSRDKQLFDSLNGLKMDLSSIKDEVDALKEGVSLLEIDEKNKQLFGKTPVYEKQTAVYAVGKPVQTAVQTGNFYQILHNLTANERLLIFTLMNAEEEMRLSYEDMARLLGKERATVRGQINAIKQKSEGLIMEIITSEGKKRFYVSEEVRNKLLKYAKVRVGKRGKMGKKAGKTRKSEKSLEREASYV